MKTATHYGALYRWKAAFLAAGFSVSGLAVLAPPLLAQAPAPKVVAVPGPDKAHAAALQADIDRALKLIADDQIETFMEDYYPLDAVRVLRKRQAFTNAANDLRRTKSVLKRIQDRLTRSRNGRLEGSNDEIVTFPSKDATEAAPVVKVAQPKAAPAQVPGYGKDLKAALIAAIADLKSGKFETFVEQMLPISEVARLKETDQLAFTAQQFKTYTEMPAVMVADLQAILDGPLKASGTVFETELPGRSPKETPRTIKLQLAGGSWRFYDQAAELQPSVDQLMEQGAQLAANPSALDPLLKFERIRDNWRLVELP